ncbi:MAG: hypothetical protein BWY31_04380 [Lentisphaerae bacterium ADurb.Bin242]|nr:MAG: hypothetical protein BWY31_04380 [Lentisphaerae bacterium ADurb.Bin242]
MFAAARREKLQRGIVSPVSVQGDFPFGNSHVKHGKRLFHRPEKVFPDFAEEGVVFIPPAFAVVDDKRIFAGFFCDFCVLPATEISVCLRIFRSGEVEPFQKNAQPVPDFIIPGFHRGFRKNGGGGGQKIFFLEDFVVRMVYLDDPGAVPDNLEQENRVEFRIFFQQSCRGSVEENERIPFLAQKIFHPGDVSFAARNGDGILCISPCPCVDAFIFQIETFGKFRRITAGFQVGKNQHPRFLGKSGRRKPFRMRGGIISPFVYFFLCGKKETGQYGGSNEQSFQVHGQNTPSCSKFNFNLIHDVFLRWNCVFKLTGRGRRRRLCPIPVPKPPILLRRLPSCPGRRDASSHWCL